MDLDVIEEIVDRFVLEEKLFFCFVFVKFKLNIVKKSFRKRSR